MEDYAIEPCQCGQGCPCATEIIAKHDLLAEDDVDIITAFFKALSDPTRFNIVYTLLKHQRLSVSMIAQLTNVSISAASHQLAILRMRKLVKVTRDGNRNYYSLCDDHVCKVIELAIEHIHE